MPKKPYSEEQLRDCLSCQTGAAVIQTYRDLYGPQQKDLSPKMQQYWEQVQELVQYKDPVEQAERYQNLPEAGKAYEDWQAQLYTALVKQDQEALQKLLQQLEAQVTLTKEEEILVQTLAAHLHLGGTTAEVYQALQEGVRGPLSSQSEALILDGPQDLPQNPSSELWPQLCTTPSAYTCVGPLQFILSTLRPLLGKQKEVDVTSQRTQLLAMMHDICQQTEGYDTKKGERALQVIRRKDKNKQQEESASKAQRYLFRQYCSQPPSYFTDQTGHCGPARFREAVARQEEHLGPQIEFMKRMQALPEAAQSVLSDYLQQAPKQFGFNLQLVMEQQDMSAQDVAKLTHLRASAVEKLQQTREPEEALEANEATLQEGEPDRITQLCRALLVSREVLTIGIGTRYGNWKNLFSPDGIQELLAEQLIPKKGAKQTIQETIQDRLFSPDFEMEQLAQQLPGFIQEEAYDLYDSAALRFCGLLHQAEAFTVLELLEQYAQKGIGFFTGSRILFLILKGNQTLKISLQYPLFFHKI